ncbi:MAG TPA: LrgB family protein [Candidatus Limnocylindria bacterium]|nr:LrgB family protein [Candidatus Limnocylindria bacterium]
MPDLMKFADEPLFGVLLSVSMYVLFAKLMGRAKSPLLNPFLFAILGVIAFLKLTGVTYAQYRVGGDVLAFFIAPSVVALAFPLYRQFAKLKANALPILAGILAGVLTSIVTGVGLAMLLGISRELTISMSSKGTTSGISMELAFALGGSREAAIAFVNVAGLSGYLVGEKALRLARIHSPVARGLALGTGSHMMGTRLAFEMGEEEGAMSSLAIGLAGVATSVVLSPIIRLLGL